MDESLEALVELRIRERQRADELAAARVEKDEAEAMVWQWVQAMAIDNREARTVLNRALDAHLKLARLEYGPHDAPVGAEV